MAKMKAGFIGFLPTKESGEDAYAVLKSYADLGYTGFETGDLLLEGDPAENLMKVKSYGLKPLTLGYMKGFGRDISVAELITNAHLLEIDRVTSYAGCVGMHRFGMRPDQPTYDEVMREIEEFEALAKALSAEGITFAFHNHDVELKVAYRGVPALYLMCAHTEQLKIELDIGWAQYAGKDPAGVIRDLGDRICALHVKDFITGEVDRTGPNGSHSIMPRFTTPGTGLLKMAECLEAGCALGLEWAVVEQDFQYNLTQKETLAAAYLNMKETGFVE